MNIWIYSHYTVTPKSSGGTRHYDLAKELVKKNYHVTIFASSFEHQSRKDTVITNPSEKEKVETIDGIQFVWVKTCSYKDNGFKRILNILGYTYRAFLSSMKMKEKPDIVIGTLMHPLAAFLGYIISSIKGCKFYFEERDLWPQTLIDLGKYSKRNPIVIVLGWLELFLYRKSDRIIILFKNAVSYIESKKVNKDKVLVLSNGVDLAKYNNPVDLPANLDEYLNTRLKDRFKAVYIGSHGISDNLEPILYSAKKLMETNKDICFLFFGDGPEKERLIRIKEKERLDNVTFFSPVSKEYIPKILDSCDAGLISLHNTELYKWGISFNKMYDYMAARLPIVMNSAKEMDELTEFGNIVWTNEANGIAETINELYTDKELRERLGRNGREYLENHFSWEKLSRDLIDVFELDLKVSKKTSVS